MSSLVDEFRSVHRNPREFGVASLCPRVRLQDPAPPGRAQSAGLVRTIRLWERYCGALSLGTTPETAGELKLHPSGQSRGVLQQLPILPPQNEQTV